MEIDFSKLTNVFNAMFKYTDQYQYMTNEIKEKNFFIILRYFSKRYPIQAQQLNLKNATYKSLGMDLIFYFMQQEVRKNSSNNPQFWFWSKSPFEKDDTKLSKEDIILMELLNIDNVEDLADLKKLYPDVVADEMEFVKLLMKNEKDKDKIKAVKK